MKTIHAKNTTVTNGRIVVLDEHLSTNAQERLKSLDTTDGQELLFLKDIQLAIGLEEILTDLVQNETLLVFPGNGANYPKKLSRICEEFPQTTSVYAERFWVPGTDPVVTAGLIFPDTFLILKIKTVVVVDDVISSGLTMRKIHENNAWKFPAAKWIGTAWISQLPLGKFVGNYKEVRVSCMVRKSTGNHGNQKVPINSLSTLRKNREIADSYARRHFKKPSAFLDLIE